MLKEITPKVLLVINLANRINKDYERTTNEEQSFLNILDIKSTDIEKELDNYLYSLEYTDIEAIEAIMILGRDKQFTESFQPEELLQKEIEYIRSIHGDGNKDLAIEYITSKAKLDIYLKNGLKILKCFWYS